MKRISNQEYDDLMAFMKPKLQSLWEHENNEREKQGRDALNMFQFGFSILDINHYLIDDECDFYLVFNGSFLRMIYDTLLNASKEHPEKFGTGDANDVIDALYDVSGFYGFGDKNRYIEFISENACCYIIYRNNKEFDNDILRIDLFRHVMPNKKDNSKLPLCWGATTSNVGRWWVTTTMCLASLSETLCLINAKHFWCSTLKSSVVNLRPSYSICLKSFMPRLTIYSS